MKRGNLLFPAAVAAGLLFVVMRARADSPADYVNPDDDYIPPVDNGGDMPTADDSRFTLTDASNLATSDDLDAMLQKGERLVLTPYQLGDGGWTVGYGHYSPNSAGMPAPLSSKDDAIALFNQDIEERAAVWVRKYVTVPINQFQFDALASMAFNLKPSSFKTIADAVNAGDDPDNAALQFVRAGTNLENGLRARRARELDLYHNGVYA